MTTVHHSTLLLATSLFLVAGFGCAEDRQLTDLDPSKEWGELSPQEQIGFCVDTEDYVSKNMGVQSWIDARCLLQAHSTVSQSFAGDVDVAIEGCEIRWEMCRDEYSPMTTDYCPGAPQGGSCTATVGEWSDCMLDFLDQMEDLASKRCSDLTFGENTSPITGTCAAELETCEG